MNDSLYVLKPDSFEIGYRENEKHWQVESHYHNDYEIVYIAKGKLQFRIDDKTYYPKKDSLIFLNNLEKHEYQILEYPYCRHVIMTKPDFFNAIINDHVLTSIFKHRPKSFNHVVELNQEQAASILEIFKRIHDEYENKKPYWESNVRLYMYLLLTSVFRVSEQHFPLSGVDNSINKKVIIDIQKYIEENYTEDINLKDISKIFHTDMYYLCHLFKEVTGHTFKSYLTTRRISSAKDLLTYTDKDITQVGLDSGFNNVNHFIRTFKKIVGITPFQYKKQ